MQIKFLPCLVLVFNILSAEDYDAIIYKWSKPLSEAWSACKKSHYSHEFVEEAMINSIKSFVHTLDPHSNFLDPKSYKRILEATNGEFFGIGVVINGNKTTESEFLVIEDVLPGGPSEKAGILPGDKIISINDELVKGIDIDEAITKLKGTKNSKLTLKIIREEGQIPLDFTIKRDIVNEASILCFYFKTYDIYYVALNTFAENSVKQLEDILKKIEQKKCKGMILDLRNNSGGLLTSAVDIAGLFLPKNSIVVTTKNNQDVVEKCVTQRNPITKTETPIFILINNSTASAAEILAGCLKVHSDNKLNRTKIFLVGTTTFGKGSVQEVMPASNDCALKITIGLYYLPDNTAIQGIGVEPDFVIERQFPPNPQLVWLNKYYGKESALKHYIKVDKKTEDKKKEDKKKKNWKLIKQDLINQDSQIKSTINLINLFDIAKKAHPEKLITRKMAIEFLKNNFVSDENIVMEEIKN